MVFGDFQLGICWEGPHIFTKKAMLTVSTSCDLPGEVKGKSDRIWFLITSPFGEYPWKTHQNANARGSKPGLFIVIIIQVMFNLLRKGLEPRGSKHTRNAFLQKGCSNKCEELYSGVYEMVLFPTNVISLLVFDTIYIDDYRFWIIWKVGYHVWHTLYHCSNLTLWAAFEDSCGLFLFPKLMTKSMKQIYNVFSLQAEPRKQT